MNRFRHEYKYMIDAREEAVLRLRSAALMKRDSHVRDDGLYVIRSLYFDDINNSCFYENESGTDPRSKFRIRYYNHDTGRIQLEKKSKRRKMTYKEACIITEDECRSIMKGDYMSVASSSDDIKSRLILEMQNRGMMPKVIVTYAREPFVYRAGNVRVTFDKMLTSSTDVEDFLTADYRKRPIFPVGNCILEVKWDEVLPTHIREGLELDTLAWTAFSKYYMCRKYSI